MSSASSDRQLELAEVTRSLALALQDDGIRHRLLADMRSAPFREHKLELRSYLQSKRGGVLLASMKRHDERGAAALSSAIDAAGALEMYMPVRTHREKWTGGTDLLVAGQLGEQDPIVAFKLDGTPIELSIDRAPDTPTLVLVPVETDFSRPLDPAQVSNVNDAGGESIGTMVSRSILPPPPDGGGGGGSPPLPPGPAGVYFTALTLRDLGENWSRGEPEIEVHIFGTEVGYYVPVQIWSGVWVAQFTGASREVWMDCAGEDVGGYRYFDFDHTGTTSAFPNYRRDVLFASTQNFAVIETLTHDQLLLIKRRVQLKPPFHIKVLERDDGKACPAQPRKYDPTFGLQLTVVPLDWSTIEPYNTDGWEILNWLLGNNNENIADWRSIDFSTLELASGTTLTGGGDADITLKNEGFSRWNIPSNQTLYP